MISENYPKEDLMPELKENEVSEASSETESDISLSEKIVFESNEKRLRQKAASLQTSITSLKEQLRLEKEKWKEDIEKIRILQQQHEMKCICPLHSTKSSDACKSDTSDKTNSIYSLSGYEWLPNHQVTKHGDELWKPQSIQQMLELQNYRRKLTETENICNMELLKVKQSLNDLKVLQGIASEWGKSEKTNNNEFDQVQEIFVHNSNM